MLARAEAQMIYGAARELHNERTRNTLKHSTCSQKWWETLKCLILGAKPSILALKGPGCGLVVAPAEKATLLGSQFDSKQCCEQFGTPLSCFPLSIGAILWPSELLSPCVCFSILIRMGVLIL